MDIVLVLHSLHALDDDSTLDGAAGVTNRELHHEAVQLCLGQWIGTLRLNGVLGRDSDERLRQLVRFPLQSYLLLLHRLQQCSLRFGRCAINFVS